MKDDYVFPRDRSGAPGIELRDWFAGQAAAGLLAHPDCGDVGPQEKNQSVTMAVAREAYAVADALLAEREKR